LHAVVFPTAPQLSKRLTGRPEISETLVLVFYRYIMLLLHGWTQSAEVITSKLHAFKRKVEKVIPRVAAMDAPHLLPLDMRKDGNEPGREPRAWWYYDPSDKTKFPAEGFKTTEVLGWPESREAIARAWSEKGPFSVICGFSQGAGVLHVLVSELEAVLMQLEMEKREAEGGERVPPSAGAGATGSGVTEGTPNPPPCWRTDPIYRALIENPPKNVIFVCGFPSAFGEKHSGFPVGKLLKTPSLHLSAINDTTVPPMWQEELASKFETSVLHRFETGHAMPSRAADLAAVTDFLSRYSK
jgi:Serine hydrolase (FSH1)